jgi:DNA (cytosine-5)-methyltransferase 1
MAGATPVAALDMWELATDTYKLNFPDAKIYRIKASSLSRQRLLNEVGEIDLLLASPECTSHSVAKGKKPQREESQATAFEVIRYAKTLRPRWIVVENVLQMRSWSRFDDWYHRLEGLGYNLKTAILDAQYYDTPQSRRRFFVVGDLKAAPSLPKQGSRTEKTVASVLGHGEPRDEGWDFSPLRALNRAAATIERAERAIKHLGRGVPFIMVYYGTDGAGGFQTLDRPLRTVTTLDRFAYVRLNGLGYEMRMLQPPELAAAMGFPDCHLWPESARRNRIKLIGNAVCPTVMRAVVEALVKKPNMRD